MARSAVIALGITQCVNWGVLYYAFAVLVVPLQRELGVSTWVVTGAFSLALLTSAALAPAVGRWGDNDRGALMLQVGGLAAAALLVAWTFLPGLLALYVVWTALGLCMATTLYEPAFVMIGRSYADPARRLRALAAVTVFGGLASTIFLPLTTSLVDAFGWRPAVLTLAALLLVAVALCRMCVSRHCTSARAGGLSDDRTRGLHADQRNSTRFPLVAGIFALATLASAAFMANLFPFLQERGLSPSTTAIVGGLMGLMQVPGRALLMHGAAAARPWHLLAGTLALQAVGLAVVASASSPALVVTGATVLGLGAGLITLVRPHLVQTLFNGAEGGHLNGRIARHQQLSRAAGPLAVAWIASHIGYTTVFLVVAAGFLAATIAASRMSRGVGIQKEAVERTLSSGPCRAGSARDARPLMPYRVDLPNGSDDVLDRLIELGALDVERSQDGGIAALMPDRVSPGLLTGVLGVGGILVSAATGRDADSVWILRPRPIRVGRFRIAPAHAEREPDAFRLVDASAFGTGLHPTTALCLETLDAELQVDVPDAVLDVGTGSGVLALAALTAGVPRARGIDVDPDALHAAAANARLNGLGRRFELALGGPETVDGTWPMVLANVLAAPLIEMAPALVRRIGHHGRLVLSGIPGSVEREVCDTYVRLGMHRLDARSRAGWVALLLQASW